MKKELYVIITAAGSGTRMGNTLAKQFITIKDQPILLRTIQLFKSIQEDAHIILVLPNEYKEYWKEYCVNNDIWFRHTIVSGGITRFHSVKNALKHVPDNCIVAIHDGVRPFVSQNLINTCIENAYEVGACIPVLEVTDTIKQVDKQDNVKKTLDRDKLRAVQTPQGFKYEILKECYDNAINDNLIATDDASIVEHYKYKVKTINGLNKNIKITTPFDLKVAELISRMV